METTVSYRALIALAAAAVMAGTAAAKGSPEEVEKLGKSLTCVGAEKAGTASGVPEYTGKWLGTPPGIQYTPHVGQHPVDPYANEKPLFSITAENMAKYAANLTDGQKGMLTRYPKTFSIPVYPGHRDFRYADFVCASVKSNAQNAVMSADGMGADNAVKGGIPFPFPKSGIELAFNNLFPFRSFTEHTLRDNAYVMQDGSAVFGRAENRSMSLLNSPDQAGKPLEGTMAQGMNAVKLPEREKGGVSVSMEPVYFGNDKRLGWSYDPGTRRVR